MPAQNSALTPYLSQTGAFRDGTDSPRDFLERAIERLEAREPELRAFVTMSLPRARIAADAATERWQAGKPLSPIDGMPIGIKDVIETADMPTQLGSPTFDGWQSGRDAASVFALREAGAIIFGKTKTTEYASTYPTDTRNPHDASRTPGGSSSGSAAAVGAGILPAALGTQVLGSVLRPASYCGAVGYKPTFGGINRGGSHDYQSQSCIGVIAASLSDTWGVAQAIVRRAGGDPGAPGILGSETLPAAKKPLRLARLDTGGWAVTSPHAREVFEEAIEELREKGVTVLSAKQDEGIAEVEKAIGEAWQLSLDIVDFESRWPARSVAYRDPLGLSGRYMQRINDAHRFGLDGYRERLGRRAQIREIFERVAKGFDSFITLGAPGAAPHGIRTTGNAIFNAPASLLGTPAVTLPVLSDSGMPLGLQLMGGQHSDEAIFSLASWIGKESAEGTAWVD